MTAEELKMAAKFLLDELLATTRDQIAHKLTELGDATLDALDLLITAEKLRRSRR